jgi:hypothetical protein
VLESDELAEIELTLQALRSHERAYIVEPPLVTFRIMVPEGGQGGATGLMDSVKHHDTMIVRGILATFLSDQAEGLNTNRTRTLADVFLHALKAEARATATDLMSQAVRPFCDLNFDMIGSRYPQCEVTGIGDISVEQLGTTLQPFVTAGVITPDDNIENVLRKLLGLPPLPEGYKRGETKPPPPTPTGPGTSSPEEQVGDEGTEQPNLADALTELAHSIEHAAQPPKPPDIVINMPGTGSKRIEYDAMTGRPTRVVHEQP